MKLDPLAKKKSLIFQMFLNNLGGTKKFCDFSNRLNVPITKTTIYVWKRAGAIPEKHRELIIQAIKTLTQPHQSKKHIGALADVLLGHNTDPDQLDRLIIQSDELNGRTVLTN